MDRSVASRMFEEGTVFIMCLNSILDEACFRTRMESKTQHGLQGKSYDQCGRPVRTLEQSKENTYSGMSFVSLMP